VRLASLDDAASVSAVLEDAYPALMAPAYDNRLLARALPRITKAKPSLLASRTYYLAELAPGVVVGCGGWTEKKPGSEESVEGVGHIRHFATRADWTGRGIGRRIYSACETQARLAGIEILECYSSLNASAFYQALGFAPIGLIEIPMGDGIVFPSVHLRKDINT
jgi:GNAT superfamily N-acetyltransferase